MFLCVPVCVVAEFGVRPHFEFLIVGLKVSRVFASGIVTAVIIKSFVSMLLLPLVSFSGLNPCRVTFMPEPEKVVALICVFETRGELDFFRLRSRFVLFGFRSWFRLRSRLRLGNRLRRISRLF